MLFRKFSAQKPTPAVNQNRGAITGQLAEQRAEHYLQQKGFTPVCRNYRCPVGEIDLIMFDAKVLVFIEVRYRKQSRYGSAAESVTPAKQRKIIRAAEHYLLNQKISQKVACRFDVISMAGDTIDWIPDAFSAVP